jgi:hypothetical protein
MRDPRTLGPYQPSRPLSILDLLEGGGASAAPAAMVQAAEPPPSVASRIAGLAGGVVGGVGSVIAAPFRAIGEQYDLSTEASRLDNERARAEIDAMRRAAEREQVLFPAQAGLAEAQARQQAAITERLAGEQNQRTREGLIRGAATGEFRPFDLEPGPAELAAYESVLGMEQEEARQRLIGQREQRQAQLDAQLQRSTYSQNRGADLELEKSKRALGPLPGSFDEASKLRGDFRADSKPFVTISESWKRLKSVADKPSAAGDLALLFNYMKILDPGSAVRESEFANAETAASIPERIRGAWQKVRTGERLDPEVRADFVAQARNQVDAQRSLQSRLVEQYGAMAQRRGINREDVIVDYDSPEAAPAATGPVSMRFPDGSTRLIPAGDVEAMKQYGEVVQ